MFRGRLHNAVTWAIIWRVRSSVASATPKSPNKLTDCIKQSGYKANMKSPIEPDLLHLLFPHVRAEVLRALFSDPRQETYGREAARTTTMALRTVQRELAMLEAVGILTSRKKGQLRLYCANPNHQLFAALRELAVKGNSGRPFVNRAKKSRRNRKRAPRSPSTKFSLIHRRRVSTFS